jgi:hypothetical protein
MYQFCSIDWVLLVKLSRVRNLPGYIPYTHIEIPMECWHTNKMLTYLTRFRLVRIWTCWRPLVVLHCNIMHQLCSILLVLVGKLSGVRHLTSYIPDANIESPMEWSHNWSYLGWSRFNPVKDLWLHSIVISHFNCLAVLGLGWEAITSTAFTLWYPTLIKQRNLVFVL